MSELTEKIKHSILEAIESDQIVLPTLPEVALNIRQVARDSQATVSQLCKVIERDPAIAARVIKVANSPLFRGNKVIENLKMAVTRLGVRYTGNFVTGVAMKQIFQATNSMVDELLRYNWTYSTEIATIAYALAEMKAGFQADQASLAGLTHRIGVLPVITFAESHPKLLANPKSLQTVIESVHQDIGEKILKSWGFSPELVEVPKNYLNFDRQAPRADYTDLVTAAVLQGNDASDHPYHHIDTNQVGAYQRLGLCSVADENDEQQNQIIEHIELAATVLSN
jgi:HD-like signal output (HDOD) protein